MLVGQADRIAWRVLSIAAAVVSAGVGIGMIKPVVSRNARFIDLVQFDIAFPQPVQDALKQPDRPIALAGDARAFLFQVPMSRLSYRTVFDVNVEPSESVVDAWTRGAPADALIIVDPNELRRFTQTYRGIPELRSDATEMFVVDPRTPP
jgi:hypothetical protein